MLFMNWVGRLPCSILYGYLVGFNIPTCRQTCGFLCILAVPGLWLLERLGKFSIAELRYKMYRFLFLLGFGLGYVKLWLLWRTRVSFTIPRHFWGPVVLFSIFILLKYSPFNCPMYPNLPSQYGRRMRCALVSLCT